MRGLTTAASLWITSALGTLYGVGFYGLAIGGTLATIAVLAAVTVTEAVLPQRVYFDLSVRYPRSAPITESRLRSILAQYGLNAVGMSCSIDEDTISFQATTECRGAPNIEALTTAFVHDPLARGFSISPHA